jgi:hypothetical protein
LGIQKGETVKITVNWKASQVRLPSRSKKIPHHFLGDIAPAQPISPEWNGRLNWLLIDKDAGCLYIKLSANGTGTGIRPVNLYMRLTGEA